MNHAIINALITDLVRKAPALDAVELASLVERLRTDGAPLAISIARVVELLGKGEVAAAISLPALASACATLGDPNLTEREREAARFEIETLLPVPRAPDVPADRLKKKS
jgi:hypothetical protein